MEISDEQKNTVKRFNEKIFQGYYAIERVLCLCGSKSYHKIADFDWYGLWHPVVICKKCGLIYTNVRLTEDAYAEFYSTDEYRKLYEGSDYLEDAWKRFDSGYGRHIFNEVDPAGKEKGLKTILEFGCAAGWNLVHFVEGDYQVTGYDYSQALVKYGKSRGLNLISGSLKDLKGKHDVIIVNHVIEHFTDFFGSMRKLISHLNKEGLLYIAVPDMDNYSFGQLQNAHTYYFTSRTLKYYLSLCRLKEIKFGVAEGIHMYGIFALSSRPMQSQFYTSKEFSRMIKKIYFAKLKSNMICILNMLGVGKSARTLYRNIVKKPL
jgi:2-polyprenyl-3-methyl-5-hydroxy-6-metoxy-1,4-benzoquinol methylase